jgi:MFS family permease
MGWAHHHIAGALPRSPTVDDDARVAVANVALPDIGKVFDASQTTLNLTAVGYSLGLAASILYLGAIGDHYGRKLMCLAGVVLSVPACLIAASVPSSLPTSTRATSRSTTWAASCRPWWWRP